MGKWSDEVGGGDGRRYLSTAVGKEVILTITEINKVTTKPDFEPKNKKGETQGFLFEFVGEEGIVTVSTFTLQSSLKAAGVDVGDTVRILHPNHGEYVVEKL